MESSELNILLNKYLKDECSFGEVKLLMSFFNSENEDQLMELVMKGFELDSQVTLGEFEDQVVLDRVHALLMSQITQADSTKKTAKYSRIWIITSAVAAITLVIFVGLFYFKGGHNKKHEDFASTYSNDILPGKKSAMLTLANGKKISLSDASTGSLLAEQADVKIVKKSDGELVYSINSSLKNAGAGLSYNTLSTEKGETYQVRLPDGTEVWLNAASILKFPVSFSSSKQRVVELIGEAYFQVAKDKKRPFLVNSSGQEIKVLGTHFNVNSYIDETYIKTTLLEGVVQVNNKVVLKPNQQSLFKKNHDIEVVDVDPDAVVAWKSGLFVFENEALGSIMRKVSRWYNVEVVYDNLAVANDTYSGTISKFDNISKVLKRLEGTGYVKFEIRNRVLIVRDVKLK